MKIFSKKLIASILTFILCVSSVAFAGIVNAEAETVTADFDDAVLSNIEVNHNGSGNYKFSPGASATVTVDIPTAGSYTMRTNILTRDQHLNIWNVYVDDVKQGTFHSWLTGGTWCDNEAVDLYFETAGEHTVKVDMSAGNAYLNGFTLTKEEYDYQAIWLLGKEATGTGSVNMEKYQIDNGGNVQEYAEYKVNVDSDGTYRLLSQTTYNQETITSAFISVNGREIGNVKISGGTRGSYGDEKVETVLGDVILKAGENTIKITNKDLPNGQTLMITRLKVDKISDVAEEPTKEPIGEPVRIPMKSYKDASFDSQEDLILFGEGDWAEFDVDIETAGIYRLGIKAGSDIGSEHTVKASVNGSEKLNVPIEISADYFEPADVVIGDLTFDTIGANVLKIENVASVGMLVEDIYIQLVEELADEPGDEPGDVDTLQEIRWHSRSFIEAYASQNENNTNELKQDGGSPDNTVLQIGNWAKYNVTVTTPGAYAFGLKLGGTDAVQQGITVFIDDVEEFTASKNCNGVKLGSAEKLDFTFGVIVFDEAGDYTLKFSKNSGGFIYCSHLFLKPMGDPIEITGVFGGETDLAENTEISAGTDVFTVEFSKNVSKKESVITLLDSKNENVDLSYSVVDNKIVIALKESLKEDESYELKIGSVYDEYDYSLTNAQSFDFTAVSGEGTESITDEKAVFDHNVATVSAKMLSSQEIGIKGRKYTVYLKNPSGVVNEVPINSDFSGNDGLIEFTYTMPSDSSDGTYTFILDSEYLSDKIETTAVYVSETLRDQIAAELNESDNAIDRYTVLSTYKEHLEIDPDTEVGNLVFSKVYDHFDEIKVEFEDIADTFRKFVAVERFNQAKESNVTSVLENDANWEAISLDKVLYTEMSDEAKEALKADILALSDGLKADEFIDALKETINSALSEDKEKKDLTLTLENGTVYSGQSVYIPVDFVEETDSIRKLSFIVEASDNAMLENADVKVNYPANVEKSVKDNKLNVNIEFTETVSSSKLGNIVLTAPASTGSYTINVSGDVFYLYESENAFFDIRTDIKNKTANITVVETPKGSGGNSSSSANSNYRPSTGSPSGGGGASTVVPVVPVTYKFTDIASNHWAYPAVDYLAGLNILDKPADKKFNPEKTTAREEIVKMLVIALGLTDTNAETTLKDVNKTNPYYVYIASAEKNGIIKGDDLGNFNIGASLTREDVCVILHRAISSKLGFTSSEDKFIDDAVISDYAKAAVYDMRGAGLINGMGNNEFAPKGNVTKAQAAKMIYEIVKAVAK